MAERERLGEAGRDRLRMRLGGMGQDWKGKAGIETGSDSLGMKLGGRARESGWERKHGNEAALEGQTDNEVGRARE